MSPRTTSTDRDGGVHDRGVSGVSGALGTSHTVPFVTDEGAAAGDELERVRHSRSLIS